MKRQLTVIRVLYILIGIQLLAGVLSIFTLSIGRAIAVFGSAALVYLGINIVWQLTSIRELLSYSAVQASFPKQEVADIEPVKRATPSRNTEEESRRVPEAVYSAPRRFVATSEEV